MSSTTRSTSPSASPSAPVSDRRSARSPTVSRQAGCGPPKKVWTFTRAMSAKSPRRSKECSTPRSPTARSNDIVSAPDPTPASTTRAPGKMSAIATICPASLG
jgi:hypothetical protein